MKKERLAQTTGASLKALSGVLRSSYKLAPVAVGCLSVVVTAVVLLAAWWSPLQQVTVLFIVFLVSVVVFATTKNFGEAALALAAGLLSVYSVTWDTGKFIAFVVVWVGFSFIALLISSIGLAAKVEDIYVQAAIFLSPGPGYSEATEKELRRIGEKSRKGMIGPVERAEVLRLLAFRRMSIEAMDGSLDAVEILSTVTKIKPLDAAQFLADVTRATSASDPRETERIVDKVVLSIRHSAVSPADFFRGFEFSKHLMFEGIEPDRYFEGLRTALERGVRPEAVAEYLRRKLG